MNSSSEKCAARCAGRANGREAAIDWRALQSVLHGDPAGRGLASFRAEGKPLDDGQLRSAAIELSEHAKAVAIVTGFCAQSKHGHGRNRWPARRCCWPAHAWRPTSKLHSSAIATPCRYFRRLALWNLPARHSVGIPLRDWRVDGLSRGCTMMPPQRPDDRWVDAFLTHGRGRQLTHLISIERPGPSHTIESFRAAAATGSAPLVHFLKSVPQRTATFVTTCAASRSTLGRPKRTDSSSWSRQPNPTSRTIGVGDGGNELGMGRFAWETNYRCPRPTKSPGGSRAGSPPILPSSRA